MYISKRYFRNMNAFTEAELSKIRTQKICILGCGGLGGQVSHALSRFGVASLSLVDGDTFQISNLNRQLFSRPDNIGKNKAEVVAQNLSAINPDVKLEVHPLMLTENNAIRLLEGHDLAIDCLDSVMPRFILAKACAKENIPLIHGAISGFFGQVAVIPPGSKLLELLYPIEKESADDPDNSMGNPVFTPQMAGAIQVSEALKVLLGRGKILFNTVLYFDLLNNSFERVDYTQALEEHRTS